MSLTNRLGLTAVVMVCIACDKGSEVDERLLTTYTQYVVLRMSATDTTSSQQRLDSLLQAKGYTRDQFYGELADYGTKPERMRVFYDSVRARVGRMQADISR